MHHFTRLYWLAVLLFFNTGLRAQQLISFESKGTISLAELAAEFGPLVQNGVVMYKIRYTTPDVQGVLDTASGLLLIPDVPDRIFPLACVQHGTVSAKDDVPSNLRGGYELGVAFAALGYVAAMPDFLGLGDSRGFHPYVHADSEASASVDMLLAVQTLAEESDLLALNDQLFITGYSQGGHAGMALHRELELNQNGLFNIAAAAHLSGPYSISGVMRDLFLGDEPYFFPAYVAFTLLSYNLVYDLYDQLEDVMRPEYVELVAQYLEGAIDLNTLNSRLIERLETDFGASIARNMFRDSILTEIITNPEHPFNLALRDNDVYEWAPEVPTRLFYCRADDQVPFRNSVIADSVMNMLGALDLQAIDVNTNADHGGCVFPAVLNTIFFFAPYQMVATNVTDWAATLPNIRLYPNPAANFIVLENAPDAALVQIFDLSGRIHFSTRTRSDNPTISLPKLPQGMYAVRVAAENGTWTGKMIVR